MSRLRLASVFVLLSVVIWHLVWAWPWPSFNEDVLHEWMGHVDGDLRLSPHDQALAMEVVRGALLSPTDAPTDPPDRLPEIFSLRDSRPVWVTIYPHGQPMRVGMSTEANLYRSLRAAARLAVLAKDPQGPSMDPNALAVQVEVLDGRAPQLSLALPFRYFSIEPGVHGVHLRRGDAEVWSPPTEAIQRGWLAYTLPSRLGAIDSLLDKVAEGMPSGGWQACDVELFTTVAFSQVSPGAQVHPLFRSNVLLTDINSQIIWNAMELGARWLLEQAKPDGTFRYAYKPAIDEEPDDYNVVRHAGTVFGLLTLANATRQQSMLDAALKGLPFLRESLQPIPGAPDVVALADGDTRSTGAGALALLALLELPEAQREPEDNARLTGLGRFLLENIDVNGRVFQGWNISRQGGTVDKEPPYYPGEAMLALARLNEVQPDPALLEGARRIADRKLFEWRWIPGGWGDHWVMQGLAVLARTTGEARYATALYEMADQSIDTQYPPNIPPWPDYQGMFRYQGAVPRVTRAGSRSEAIRAAMHLAWSRGDDARRFEDSLIIASKATIEQMFRQESAFWMRRPERAIGGITGGPLDDLLRIDFNQHGLVGLLGGLEAALHLSGAPPPWQGDLPATP